MEKVGEDLCDLEVGAVEVICCGTEDKMGNWSWKSGSRDEDLQYSLVRVLWVLSNPC